MHGNAPVIPMFAFGSDSGGTQGTAHAPQKGWLVCAALQTVRKRGIRSEGRLASIELQTLLVAAFRVSAAQPDRFG